MATSYTNVQTGNSTFDELAKTVIEDLREFHGPDFDIRQLTCEYEKTNLAEVSLSISYHGEPALWQTLDLLSDSWKMQLKRWSSVH